VYLPPHARRPAFQNHHKLVLLHGGDFITYTTIIKKQFLSDLQKRREKKEEGEEELPHDDGSRATRLRM
jgi:hypothetical protein